MRSFALWLVPFFVLGQSGGVFRRGRPESGKKKPVLGLLVGGAQPSQTGTGILKGSRGEGVTVARASTRTCIQSSGMLVSLASNTPCVEAAGLSIENAHTNVLLRSQEIGNLGVWTPIGSSSTGLLVSASDATAAPDGTTTAETLTPQQNVAPGGGNYCLLRQNYTATSGLPYTFSVWVKIDTVVVAPRIYINDGVSALLTTRASLGTGWQRISVTLTVGSSNVYASVGYFDETANVGGQAFEMWGAQLEQAPYARSYVPTAGTSATTLKDGVTMAATSVPVAAGSVEVNLVPLWSTAPGTGATLVDTRNGDSFAGVAVYVTGTAATCILESGSSVTSSSLIWTPGSAYKLKCRWGSGNLSLYRNGTLLASIANGSAAMPTAQTTVRLGDGAAALTPLEGHLNDFRVYR